MASQAIARSESIAPVIPALERLISLAMDEWKVPGLATVVVQDDEVALVGAYGLRDVEAGLKVTTEIARKRSRPSSDSTSSAVVLNIGEPNYLSHRSGVKQSPTQLRRVGARLLAPSRPKMRSRLRRLRCVFSPLCGFGCGSDLATGHPGRRQIVAPGGCHANPDQTPDLLGLYRIDLFCLGGSLH
jgi:hypothetical protein